MSSTVSSTAVVNSRAKGDYGNFEKFKKRYLLEKCGYHLNKEGVLELPPWQLLNTEISEFTANDILNLVTGRTHSFHNIVGSFRKDIREVDISSAPLTFYVYKHDICVEMARAGCHCRHNFLVEKQDFYTIIRDSKLVSLDIQVNADSYDMLEFIAFTLPGVWCRELQALNIVFKEDVFYEPLATLLKKSRNLSRLRVSHNSGVNVIVSQLISNLGCLEELELNCPDDTGSGYYLDETIIDFIVTQDTRTGKTKPFRTLKVFNATFDFDAKQFMSGCKKLSKLSHNQTYEEYESLNDVRGRGGFDLDIPGNTINFEVTPCIPRDLSDKIFRQIWGTSKSYFVSFTPDVVIPRYFMIDNTMFRLLDYNPVHHINP